MKTENKRLMRILAGALSLLLIPFIAMRFTTEVNWDEKDFLAMGILLTVFALLLELVLRLVEKTSYRILLCAGFFLVFILIWAELAVGIFNSPLAGS